MQGGALKRCELNLGDGHCRIDDLGEHRIVGSGGQRFRESVICFLSVGLDELQPLCLFLQLLPSPQVLLDADLCWLLHHFWLF